MPPPLPSSSFTTGADLYSENSTLTLIPGLPDDLAALILAFLPYSHHGRLKSICKSWKQFFSSRIVFSTRHKHIPFIKRSHLLCIFPQDPSISSPYLFDPQNLAWCYLPPMPCNPHVYGLCNFTSVSHDSNLYVLGGSLFDTRSFPLDRPSPSSAAFRYDFVTQTWDSLPPMLSPRGSFACAAIPNTDRILVAGGGSRHTMFGAAGSRMSSVEMYDIGRNEWVAMDGLPRFRAGCVGFMVGKEFWVMGGYGESRTILGVFPVDEYYRDARTRQAYISMAAGGISTSTSTSKSNSKRTSKLTAPTKPRNQNRNETLRKTQTKKNHASGGSRGHEIAAGTITASSGYACLHLINERGTHSHLDALSVHTYLISALTQFLGLSGTAIAFDILKVDTDICWIRVAREDLTAFLAAVACWGGMETVDQGRVSWRVRVKGNWLGQLLAIDGQRVWDD